MQSRKFSRSLPVSVVFSIGYLLIIGTRQVSATAVYGGGTCDVPGAAPGATSKCTSTTNGWCLMNTLNIETQARTGVCICYDGYSGTMCQTASPTAGQTTGTGGSRGNTNAVGALALGAIAAFALSQIAAGATGGGLSALGY